jgi:uncharacterized protein YktA (UPF0223 family)
MATKFLRKIILEELRKVLKEGLGTDIAGPSGGNLTAPSGMPRSSSSAGLKQAGFDYYAGKIKNSDVGQLQQYLIDLGYKVMPTIPGEPQRPDGYIGPRTLKAAREVFQDQTLTEDDLMGAIKRWNKIAAAKVNKKSVSATYEKPEEYPDYLKDIVAGKVKAPEPSKFGPSTQPEFSSSTDSSLDRIPKEGDEMKSEKGMMVYKNGQWVDKFEESIAKEIKKLLRKL